MNAPVVRNSPYISLDDFRVIRDNLAGINRTTRDRMIPSCLSYLIPAVAHAVFSRIRKRPGEALPLRVLKLPTAAAVLISRTIDETRDLMRALIEPTAIPFLVLLWSGQKPVK